MSEERTGLTWLGKLLSFVMIAALVAVGVYLIKQRGVKVPGGTDPATHDAGSHDGGTTAARATDGGPSAAPAEPAEMKAQVPQLDAPGTYVAKDNIVDIELSEYAGYSGLIAANGGLEPSENSVFFRK